MEESSRPFYTQSSVLYINFGLERVMKCRHNSDGTQSSPWLSANTVGIYTNLVLILTAFAVCGCEAQSDSGPSISFILPIVIVGVVGCVMFFIICACVCAVVCFTASRSTSRPSYQYTYSSQGQRLAAAPTTGHGSSYPVQSQRYPAQSSSVPYPTTAPNTVLPEEPVSLPEAALHHGDAPPGYEEAIRMKTVGNVVTS